MSTRRGRILCLACGLGVMAAGAAGLSAPVKTTGSSAAKIEALKIQRAAASSAAAYEQKVQPFLAKSCVMCHNGKSKSAGLDLAVYRDTKAALAERDVWENVLQKLVSGEMPPSGLPRPKAGDVEAVSRWIEEQIERHDRSVEPDPGRVTARRLNRAEYNNTIRDLLAVNIRPADDFPADDAGYGFDNIGDVLTISPVLMEKYLAAADRIARQAVVTGPPLKATRERYQADRVKTIVPGELRVAHVFPAEAEYQIRSGFIDRRKEGGLPAQFVLLMDGRQVAVTEVPPGPNRPPRLIDVRVPVTAGEHNIRLALLNEDARMPPEPPEGPANRVDLKTPERRLFVDYLEIRGPFDQKPAHQTASYRKIFTCGHAAGLHQPGCGRKVLGDLARRAWRRPAAPAELDRLGRLVAAAQAEGETFEEGIQLALKAVLVSPHFLFRIERDPAQPGAIGRISDFEFATRLSYFLWSSTPDDELLRVAELGTLRMPHVLEFQTRRMLRDPRARALVENFAGQWLQLRNLDSLTPDPQRFPMFDDELREAMRLETELFFENLIREDRSILDFLDADYTFLNERLARHYGIDGVNGSHFRRVPLSGARRTGVLTHASILTVSSYPTRTSPVLRGKWILENILNAPPPPPPAGVPNLDEDSVGITGTVRQQLEKHRENPACAVCHTRMDAIGFGLENFDPIGAWRTNDGKFPVDSAGVLPNGKSFNGPAELIQVLKADSEDFNQCLTEKMLTYALGRGLERYDKPAIRAISRGVAAGEHRFSALVMEIVNSLPFRMRRGETEQQSSRPEAVSSRRNSPPAATP